MREARKKGRKDRRIHKWTDGQMNGWTDEQTDRQIEEMGREKVGSREGREKQGGSKGEREREERSKKRTE